MYASEGSPPQRENAEAPDAWASSTAVPAGAHSMAVGGGGDLFTTVRHHVQSNRFKEAEELVEIHPGLTKQVDEKGNTLLTIACQNNKKRFVKLFLRHGADINAKNDLGNTALHYCSSYSYHELGEDLISKQADASLRNNSGLTAVEVKSMRLSQSGREGSAFSVALKEAMPSIAETSPAPGASVRPPPPSGPPKSVSMAKRPSTSAVSGAYSSFGGPRGPPPGGPPNPGFRQDHNSRGMQPTQARHHSHPSGANAMSSKPSAMQQRPQTTMRRSPAPPQTLRAAPEIWNTAVPVFHGDGTEGSAGSDMYDKARRAGGTAQTVKSSQNLKSTSVPIFHADELRYFMEQNPAERKQPP